MKFILVILSCIILLSCSQSGGTVANQAEISFDINGVHYAHVGEQTVANGFTGVYAVKAAGIPATDVTY
jgi:hypothetical protein